MEENNRNGTTRHFYPKEFKKLEKKRSEAQNRALISEEIASLLSMRFNGELMYEGIESFYSDDYKKALEDEVSSSELDKIEKYRAPTPKEINLLYCDVHAREEALSGKTV